MNKSNKQSNGGNFDSIFGSGFMVKVLADFRILVKFRKINLHTDFKHFYAALTQLHRLNISKATQNTVVSRVVLFYIGFFFMHDSRFTTYLYGSNKIVMFPTFVMSILLKVCLPSKTSNPISGFTDGAISSDILGALKLSLKTLYLYTDQDWRQTLSGTDVSSIVSGSYAPLFSREFKILLCSHLHLSHSTTPEEFSSHVDDMSEHQCFDFIVDVLQGLNVSYYNQQSIEYHQGPIEMAYLQQLGIYRFQNYNEPGLYRLPQHTLNGLTSLSADIYACFLGLFLPTYYLNGELTGGNFLTISDTVISVQDLSPDQYWLKYLSLSGTTLAPSNTPASSSSKSKKPTLPQAKEKVTSTTQREFSSYPQARGVAAIHGRSEGRDVTFFLKSDTGHLNFVDYFKVRHGEIYLC